MLERIVNRTKDIFISLREVIYGMSLHSWVRDMEKSRADKNRLFTLIVYGDILGIPILPPYYILRLLPYMTPTINTWKRSMLRERDMTDLIG